MSSPANSPSDPSDESPTDGTPSGPSPPNAPSPPAPPSHDLDEARERLRVERRILGDERSAFRAFADRLLATRGPVRTAVIESHYRETVMAVPHYETEYGDGYLDSVAAEFGTVLAADCQRTERVDERTVDALREAAGRCRRRRDRVVDLIDAERHSVATAAEALDAVVDRLDALDGGDGGARLRLTMLRDRCDDVARDRRDHRQSTTGRSGDDGDAISQGQLQSLCYRELPTDRPVLAAVESLRRAIERRRQDFVGRRGGPR